MAVVVKSARASMDATTAMIAPQISGLIAGEAIAACAFCYIKGADGKVYNADTTAADEKAKLAGVCPRAANAGEPVTLFGVGTVLKYSDLLLTPGVVYYLDVTANKGGLNDTATIGDTAYPAGGHVQAISTSAVRIIRAI